MEILPIIVLVLISTCGIQEISNCDFIELLYIEIEKWLTGRVGVLPIDTDSKKAINQMLLGFLAQQGHYVSIGDPIWNSEGKSWGHV